MKIMHWGSKKIADNIFQVGSSGRSHPFDCAVYVLSGPSGAVLVDCGSPFGIDNILRNIENVGIRPESIELVLGTHCHYDHVGGFAALKKRYPRIRLAMHEFDAAVVERGDNTVTCADWLFDEVFEQSAVDIVLQDRSEISAGGITFNVISTPGHSPGSISYVTESEGKRIVFTGDSYIPSCTSVGYDFEQIVDTWRLLIGLKADIICPGHENHLSLDPIVGAMRGGLRADIIRATIGFIPLIKPLAAASSFYYEHLGLLAKPFYGLIK